MVFGVDVFDLDFRVQIDSIEQPIKSNSVGSGNMSSLQESFLWWSSWSLLHCPQTNTTELLDVRIGHLKEQNECLPLHRFSFETYDVCDHHYQVAPIHLKHEKHFQEQKQLDPIDSRAGNPSNLSPVSREMISDSVELCETAVCFLHTQLMGTNVWLPKTHNVPPEVDFESSRSPAKPESWNSPSLHCLAVLPTWQYCLYSHVWWM